MSGRAIGGRYELEQPLGGGATSAVWLARDTELERRVAVKLLARDADRARFEREAHAVAGLAHPNICQLYDYGESEAGPYMVLEWLPGGTLEDRLAGRPLPDGETARIAHQIAAGLAHAHARGLVHRDLKPANVLFDGEDRAKIADFGIARIEDQRSLTEAGTVLGTAAYISPEQAAGAPATAASDVYSFGGILFRMLTGRTPFVSNSAIELVRLHREETPPRVEELRADAPPLLAGLADAALAKEPAARPADGAALLRALSGAVEPTTLIAPAGAAAADEAADDAFATQVIIRDRRPGRGRRALLPIGIAAALALGVVGAAVAYVVTGSDGGGPGATPPDISLPAVGRQQTGATTATTAPATSPAPATSAAPPTTSSTSTAETTQTASTVESSTAATSTTLPATTALPTTSPATTAPPATSIVVPTTSVELPTTTAELPPTTAAAAVTATTAP
jgi:serine/threonine-protein kinase